MGESRHGPCCGFYPQSAPVALLLVRFKIGLRNAATGMEWADIFTAFLDSRDDAQSNSLPP